ncbi:type I restriction-modification system S [Klebsiella phage vB_KpnM_JustaPhage]|uniref:Type I restriction-modification system S n=3 Tax=Jameshumphriesvirinae TaxID=3152215 RepID=A0AAE8YR96_9CAUD|nr:type I restriction-modification system S [Klebsiella phage vB_KpnM_JustaPhage]UGO49415.1 type I restriction-modification system S [Klebsiella phage vB_KpnM_JustaPhage]
MSLVSIVILLRNVMWQMVNAVIVGDNKMYKMSKKSLTGRIIVLPVFIIILVVESILNKADDWSYSVKRLRIRMNEWIDKKFPLG